MVTQNVAVILVIVGSGNGSAPAYCKAISWSWPYNDSSKKTHLELSPQTMRNHLP